MIRQLIFVSLISAFASLSLCAQQFNGYIYSDFSGVLSTRVQPARIAGSPYKYDFNVLNTNYYVTNNIGFLQRGAEGTKFIRHINQESKFLHTNIGLGGLSAMLSLPRNQGLAIQFQMKSIGSINNMSPDFISQVNRFNDPRFLDSSIADQSGDFAFSLWQEFSLTYAFIKKGGGFHRWKVGATLKFVNPIANIWAGIGEIDYAIDDTGLASFSNFVVEAGYSSNLDDFELFDGTESFNKLPKGTGFKPAADIGVVYERVAYRPDPRAENGTGLERDITYEFRLGASITDIGRMQFEQGSAAFSTNGVLPGTGLVDFNNLFGDLNSFRELRTSLESILQVQDKTGSYTVTLPTSLNLNYDYNFGNKFYINAAGRFDLTGLIPADYRVNYPSSITVTPRHETGISGFYLPIYFNLNGDTDIGIAFRYGPFTLGTPSFSSLLSSEKESGGAFFSLSLNKLKANSKKPYCFGASRVGSGFTRTKRTPLYKRKKFLFF